MVNYYTISNLDDALRYDPKLSGVFTECSFEIDPYELLNSIKGHELFFEECIFNEDITISGGREYDNIFFYNCSGGKLEIYGCKIDVLRIGTPSGYMFNEIDDIKIQECEIDYLCVSNACAELIILENCNIREMQIPHRASIEKLYIAYCTFMEEFNDHVIDEEEKSDISVQDLFIHSCRFYNRVNLFALSYVSEHIEIQYSIFNSGLLINDLRSDSLQITISLSEINGIFTLDNSRLLTLNIDRIAGNYVFSADGLIQERVSRSLACFLKNEALKRNDYITAMEYRKIELAEHYKEFTCKNKKGNRSERFLLWLNMTSNSFGTNWVRAIWFTVGCASLFLILISLFGFEYNPLNEMFLSTKSLGENVDRFLQWLLHSLVGMVNVFNFKDTIGGNHLNGYGEVLYYLSKVFVSYGIFQMVSAFRKYGR